jgi:hypothetical protein
MKIIGLRSFLPIKTYSIVKITGGYSIEIWIMLDPNFSLLPLKIVLRLWRYIAGLFGIPPSFSRRVLWTVDHAHVFMVTLDVLAG